MKDRLNSASVIVADSITIDPESNTHTINRVRNSISVTCMPTVGIVDILAKLFFEKQANPSIKFQVTNSAQELLYFREVQLKNMREEYMDSGCDIATNVRFLILEEGKYKVQICTENEVIAEHPLYVKLVQ